jgi:hypothetical protein
LPFASVASSAFGTAVNQVEPEKVARVVDEFVNALTPETESDCAKRFPIEPFCAKRFVDEAIVAKNADDVAFARVLLPLTVRFPPKLFVPVVVRSPLIVDEACEMKPFWNVARPVCTRAPPRVRSPETDKVCAASVPMFPFCANKFVDDAVAVKKFVDVALESVVLPVTAREASVERPETLSAPPNVLVPVVVRSPLIVDEACERKPLWKVARPI